MNFASSPLYISSPFASSYWTISSPSLDVNTAMNPWRDEMPSPVQYDDRGRLQPYVETTEQRRARLAFLRKSSGSSTGKLSRRISVWIDDPDASENDANGDNEAENGDGDEVRTPSPCLASSSGTEADMESDDQGYMDHRLGLGHALSSSSRRSSSSSLSSLSSLRTISEEDESLATEPEVIYSTSPSPSSSPRWSLPPTYLTQPSRTVQYQHGRSSSDSSVSHAGSALSAIEEED